MDKAECYRILGLRPEATAVEIQTAYRDLVKVWHPDRFATSPRLQEKASEMMKQINIAYDTLQSPSSGDSERSSEWQQPPEHGTPPREPRRSAERQPAPKSNRSNAPGSAVYVGFWEGLLVMLGILATISLAGSGSSNGSAASTRQIRDATGCLRGTVEAVANGRLVGKDSYGRTVGEYLPDSDVTSDAYGRIVGYGDHLAHLILQD